ncbi:cell division protein FtsW [[Clostridium] methylpentosum DSM 5476]|uniref:Probable peptidoglycan glycosyltransferase FtsW n=1 Tax=[Clostridium] methylpentosum DSM 5476 TaxID=537013 RepID=C0EHA9_9FIRM|nr:cell division protein FtsW [[Clostridium] methylpentosum DSM 5476]MDY3987887.1 putative lipid II flippase FtsW [Massilioclostridium sp.]MEE1492055.1 putative lipid II flippase FtsW [Massilioclostridium sp.]
MAVKKRVLPGREKQGKMDLVFFILVLVLLAFGLIMLFSASYANAYYYKGNSFQYIGRQAVFAVIGVIAMLVISRIDYHFWRKFAPWIFLVALLLMIAVLFTKGDENGIKRWFYIGPFQFQPSEIMKFAIILLFSAMISTNYKKMSTFKNGVLPYILILGVVSFLMYKEPHLSGTILILGIGAVLMFVGGTKPRWFIMLGGVIAVFLTFALTVGKDYMGDRFYYWLHPFSDPMNKTLQTDQSLLSIGSGGLLGLGLGKSKQKYMYLPEPQNDFIFAIVCEELGFIGAVLVILLFILFVYKGFSIASKSPDKFGMLLCVGVAAQIGVQALLNIAVVTNSIPNTGISLPFFSYGGTALTMQLAEIGVILNVSRHAAMEKT